MCVYKVYQFNSLVFFLCSAQALHPDYPDIQKSMTVFKNLSVSIIGQHHWFSLFSCDWYRRMMDDVWNDAELFDWVTLCFRMGCWDYLSVCVCCCVFRPSVRKWGRGRNLSCRFWWSLFGAGRGRALRPWALSSTCLKSSSRTTALRWMLQIV